MIRILVVDDEQDLCEILDFNLRNEGFEVTTANSAEEALELIGSHPRGTYALILLDVMMERMSGFEMAQLMRQQGDETPIIFLTARDAHDDQLTGFASGADDYITKPFNPLELIARVKSQIRRYTNLGSIAEKNTEGVFKTGGLVIDDASKTVTLDGEAVQLTPTEYGILKFLTENAGRVFSIEQIYESVWNEPAYNPENTVTVHIRRIREKIEIDPKNPRYLKVVWGQGYKIEKS